MKKAAMIAAVAAIAAPSFALAGGKVDPVMEDDVFVDTTPAPAGSSGSLGSAGAGTAIAVGLLAAAAIAAADGS